MEQVVGSHCDVQNVPRFHAVGIMIVVLGARLRQRRPFRRARVTGRRRSKRIRNGGRDAIARETNRRLLIRSQGERGGNVGTPLTTQPLS